jgi:hypothetical protein
LKVGRRSAIPARAAGVQSCNDSEAAREDLKAFPPSCVAYRPPKWICRYLTDRESQPFGKGSIQFQGILGAIRHCRCTLCKTSTTRSFLRVPMACP